MTRRSRRPPASRAGGAEASPPTGRAGGAVASPRAGARRARIVVADDSEICRIALRRALEENGELEVVAEARDLDETLGAIAAAKPDLATVDLEMPGGGLRAISRVMAEHPTPILVVTGTAEEGSDVALEAIRRGALDLAPKADLLDREQRRRLRDRVRELATVRVVRHLRRRSMPPAAAPRAAGPIGVVAIAASAGGPAALASVLAALAPKCRVPILVVQHTWPEFAPLLAKMLRSASGGEVRVVDRAIELRPGAVHVAAPDRHLVVPRAGIAAPSDAPPVRHQRPSADVLFRSVAEAYGARGAAVVLSGIGDDGAQGVAMLRGKGGLALASDEATSAVYGMPRSAIAAGAASIAQGDVADAILAAIR
jgi:two-component system chemotaxis response regulator CheB